MVGLDVPAGPYLAAVTKSPLGLAKAGGSALDFLVCHSSEVTNEHAGSYRRLKHRHQVLEEAIDSENARPHPDDEVLHELKKKLKLKDEILSLTTRH